MDRTLRFAGWAAGQFGDLAIMTVPSRVLKQHFPGCELTFCLGECYRDMLPLFLHHKHIDDLHVWRGYDAPKWPDAEDTAYIQWRGFDHVFSAMPSHSRPDWYNHLHYGEEACARYGLPVPEDYSYHLNPWMRLHKDRKRVVTLSLFPSKGGQMSKGLTIAEAEKLCVALRKLGYEPIQLGGRFEPKLEGATAPDLSILEATTLMLSSALHVTADTGFSSIAAAYHHPTIGFYGLGYADQTDCWSHLPPNRNAHYLRNVVPNDVTAEQLVETAREKGLLSS